jgi:hypothetical protein
MSMINSSYLRLRGNEFRLANPPENVERPRRIRFSFPHLVALKMLWDAHILFELYPISEAGLTRMLIDRCFLTADISNAYQLDIWYDLRTRKMNLTFSLID